jgi:hypothetical protein
MNALEALYAASNEYHKHENYRQMYHYLKIPKVAYNGLGNLSYEFYYLARNSLQECYQLSRINLANDDLYDTINITDEAAIELIENPMYQVTDKLLNQQTAIAKTKNMIGAK